MIVSVLLPEGCSHEAPWTATRSRRRADFYLFSISNIVM
jgi:hypothetical protein